MISFVRRHSAWMFALLLLVVVLVFVSQSFQFMDDGTGGPGAPR